MNFQKMITFTSGLLFALSFLVLGNLSSGNSICEASGIDDEQTYANQTATSPIEGVVMMTFTRTNKRFPAAYTFLIFQRLDCKRCVYDARTNKDGEYKIRLAVGKYKLIVRNGSRMGETYDEIALGQVRTVESKISPISTNFDIELVNHASSEDEVKLNN